MAERGRFVWGDRSADLDYTVQGDYYFISSIGNEAHEFFSDVPEFEVFTLHKSNGEELMLTLFEEIPPNRYKAVIQRKP